MACGSAHVFVHSVSAMLSVTFHCIYESPPVPHGKSCYVTGELARSGTRCITLISLSTIHGSLHMWVYLVGLSSIYYISKDLHSTCKKFTFTTAETARQSCYRALN